MPRFSTSPNACFKSLPPASKCSLTPRANESPRILNALIVVVSDILRGCGRHCFCGVKDVNRICPSHTRLGHRQELQQLACGDGVYAGADSRSIESDRRAI